MPPVAFAILLAAAFTASAPLVRRLPAADGRCYSPQRTFQVPYTLENPPSPDSLLKPTLYYSTDGGRNWRVGAVDVDGVPPVTFTAPADGEYWLRMGFRKLGQRDTPNLGTDRNEVLVVVVDTRPPRLRLQPRLVEDQRGPAVALRVLLEDEPLEVPDISLEVEMPLDDFPSDSPSSASTGTPPGALLPSPPPRKRFLWIEHAEPGREYRWLLEERGGWPIAFHAVAVDRAGNVGRDSLELSCLQGPRKAFKPPDRVGVRRVRALPPRGVPSAAKEGLAVAVEYTIVGPPLGPAEGVQLWYTTDGGRSWRAGPMLRGKGGRRGWLTFVAPRPGLYGLRLVLRRGERIIGGAPGPGTPPQHYILLERAPDEAVVAGVRAAENVRLGAVAGANEPADILPGNSSHRSGPRGPKAPPQSVNPPVRGSSTTASRARARSAYLWGNYLRLQGRFSEAVRCFRQAVKLNPRYFDALNDLAGCLYQLGQFEEAVRVYYRAVDLRPADPDVRFSLARTLMRVGRREEALSQLDEVTRLNPSDGEAWLLRGDLLLASGRETEAHRCWKRAASLGTTDSPWASTARERLLNQSPPQHR